MAYRYRTFKKFKHTFRKGRKTFTKYFKSAKKRYNAKMAMKKRGWR